MNAADFATHILARLDMSPATITVHDGLPAVTPPGNYVYVAFDSGMGRRGHLGYTDRQDHTVVVVCVGFDTAGVRFVTDQARTVLTDYRPGGNHPLVEVSTGPQLTDGPVGDIRESITLTFQLVTRRNR